MMFPQKKENTKLSALKAFFEYYEHEILAISAAAILVVGMFLAIVLPIQFAPTHITQGTVTAVGYKGVTVEYKGEYGQDVKKEINVDDVTEYQIGDTVTIKIKVLNVKIIEECDSIDS